MIRNRAAFRPWWIYLGGLFAFVAAIQAYRLIVGLPFASVGGLLHALLVPLSVFLGNILIPKIRRWRRRRMSYAQIARVRQRRMWPTRLSGVLMTAVSGGGVWSIGGSVLRGVTSGRIDATGSGHMVAWSIHPAAFVTVVLVLLLGFLFCCLLLAFSVLMVLRPRWGQMADSP